MSPNQQASFWQRMELQERDRDVCIRAIQDVYPNRRIDEHGDQGYCSFTLVVSSSGSSKIVQIRPSHHSLNLSVAQVARNTYGAFAPMVRSLDSELPGGLRAVEMDLLNGIPLSQLQHRSRILDADMWGKQVRLIESFASFIAQAWPLLINAATQARHVRNDSPMLDGPRWLAQCRGKVGANIVAKLAKLARDLPDPSLRRRAMETLDGLLSIKCYPVVMNHGDLIPTNILVDEETWEITGVVDWAEAEWLPFGMCLYGLDHLLGFLDCSLSTPKFRYYDGAAMLRKAFWQKLVETKPDMQGRLEDVSLMRDAGVLLWLGYAWDEGKIDRVVNEVDDMEELARLRAFLGVRNR